MQVRRHRLSSVQLTDIAWGRPDASTIQEIYAADDSRQKLLVAGALRRSGRTDPQLIDALAVLEAAQRRDAQAVTDLVRADWLGPWAAGLLDGPDGAGQAASRLGSLAAVAALSAGLDARLTVGVHAGIVHLPNIGSLALAEHATSDVVLEVRDGRLDVTVAGSRPPVPMTPVRTVHDGDLRLLIDDQHPGRDCFHTPPAPRLSETAFRQWAELILASWRLLSEVAPVTARQVAQGIRVLVPLTVPPHGEDTSVSCAEALGAIATTPPPDPVHFAATLVHEWSHTLLNGMLGFVSLHEPVTTRSSAYFAPWRPDPRPISGVLHGTFAFLAITELWRALLAYDGVASRAAAELALRRLQLAEVLATLPAAPELTAQGRRFVHILQQRHAALMDIPLRRGVAAEAAARIRKQRVVWERQNRS
ncbi:MAG: HEXXH motif-containing putative peptide modification protein [Actinoplanes sp.]